MAQKKFFSQETTTVIAVFDHFSMLRNKAIFHAIEINGFSLLI